MKDFIRPLTAILLALALFEAILTIWLESRWPVSLYESTILVLAAAWCVRLLFRPLRLAVTPTLIPLAAIVALGALQLLTGFTISRWPTQVVTLHWTVCLAAFLLALQIGSIPAIRSHLLRAFVVFGFLFSSVAAVQYLVEPSKVFGFFDPEYPAAYLGPFSNRDHYAAFIELLLPIALYQALSCARLFIPCAIAPAMMFASVIEGASRAGSFLVVAETAIILVLAYRRRLPSTRGGVRAFAILLAGMLALTAALGWTRLYERAQESNPYDSRRLILQSAWEMIRERPLTGFGFGNFQTAYPAYAHYDDGELLTHAHNDWAEWTVEGGFPLSLLMLALVVVSAPALWRNLWAAGVLSVFIHGLIDFPMQRPPLALWLFVLLGLACAPVSVGKNSS